MKISGTFFPLSREYELRKLLSLIALTLFFAPAAFADDSKAQEVLKQARAAIGGEEQLQKSRVCTSTAYRRMFGERQMAGDREISILPSE